MSNSWTQRLREVLLDPQVAMGITVSGATKAAVLAAIYLGPEDELRAIFTKRREDLRTHAGQISFPGGRQDPTDPDLCSTALREAQEEIGLNPTRVEILGALQPTPTIVTDFAVYPFVGALDAPDEWVAAPNEVAAVLDLSLTALRAGYERHTLTRRGISFETDCYVDGPHLIWGATARMLGDLFERLDHAGF